MGGNTPEKLWNGLLTENVHILHYVLDRMVFSTKATKDWPHQPWCKLPSRAAGRWQLIPRRRGSACCRSRRTSWRRLSWTGSDLGAGCLQKCPHLAFASQIPHTHWRQRYQHVPMWLQSREEVSIAWSICTDRHCLKSFLQPLLWGENKFQAATSWSYELVSRFCRINAGTKCKALLW